MEDLLAVQIKNSCKLAIPDGLKELMSDISREVLRAKPTNIYSFIANYLSALLVTRQHITMASHICNCIAEKELEDTLMNIGLTDDVAEAIRRITQYFDEPTVKEGDILCKLTENTENIDEEQLISVQNAIRMLYQRHKNRSEDIATKLASLSTPDEIQEAVRHTLNLYKKCQPSEEQYNQMAVKIQAAYRAYGVRREKVQSFETFPNDWDASYRSSENSTDSDDDFFYKGQQMSYCPSDFSFLAYKLKLAKRENSDSINNYNDSDEMTGDQNRRCTVTFNNFSKYKEKLRQNSGTSTSKLSEGVENASIENEVEISSKDTQEKKMIINIHSDLNLYDLDSFLTDD